MSLILEVVHIPELAIIRQGSDSLSKGLWYAPDPARRMQWEEVARLFAPVWLTTMMMD